MYRKGSLIVAGFLLFPVLAVMAQSALPTGTVVFAEWGENSWYHGTVAETCADGYLIVYDDGDTKCCTLAEIVLDAIPDLSEVDVESRVLAQWGRGQFYPGSVSAISDGEYVIAYDDGDRSTVSLAQIRLFGNHGAEGTIVAVPQVRSPIEATPVQTTVDEAVTIWRAGSSWAEIEPDGSLWIDGSHVGQITADGKVYRDGSNVGEVDWEGTIWIGGSSAGDIDMNGRLWRGSSTAGTIAANGEIWKSGSRWGEIDPFSFDYSDMKVIAAILAFFAPEFAFIE
jgi:DNA repair Crb2-like protein